MWADNETTEDLLGFRVHADLLLDVIKDDEILPVSIGVFGEWGSGKSSILKMMYEDLKSTTDDLKDDTLVLYFNGWVFEGYDDAKAALLESIIREFKKNSKLSVKIGDQATKLLKSVNWMRVIGLGFKKIALPAISAYATGGLSFIPWLASELKNYTTKDLIDKLQGENAEEFLSGLIKDKKEEAETIAVREFREDFEDLIKKSNIKKLVVIIDDLDRCTYERIIDNLEAIKLFLNVENTAFIIGADPRIVRQAIAHHYRIKLSDVTTDQDDRDHKLVNDYLEKLIQVPYNLPRLSDHEVETYMTLLFCKRELKETNNKIITAFKDFRSKNRYAIFGFTDIQPLISQEEKSKLETSIVLIASLSSIIAEGLQGNPRQIKRFLNTFILRRKLAEVAAIPDFKIDVLAKLMILEYTFPDLFHQLYNWQAAAEGRAEKLSEIEAQVTQGKPVDVEGLHNSWKLESIKRWIKAEPLLGGLDLSDYFWIARDQLMTSISGGTLVPVHIRELFKSLTEHGSASILKNLVEKIVKVETPLNCSHLYSLLEKELIKHPEKTDLHKIFIELMVQGVTNSFESYNKVITIVDNNTIPFSLRTFFDQAIVENPDLEKIRKIFKPGSKIHTALNPKK